MLWRNSILVDLYQTVRLVHYSNAVFHLQGFVLTICICKLLQEVS